MSTVENCGNGTHGHGTFNSNKKRIILITQLIEYRSKLAKRTAKRKKKSRQLSKTDVSDCKLECAKIFIMKFCENGFRQKFQSVLEYVFKESDKHAPVSSLCSPETKD